MGDTFEQLGATFQTYVPNLLAALAILVVGWLIALGVSAAVRALLSRTRLDDRLANALSGHSSSANVNTEGWISAAVFWLIMLFVLIAFFQALELTAITTPLNNMLGQFFAFLPNILGALLLLGIAWLTATVLRLVVSRGLKAMNIDQRLGEQLDDSPPSATQGGNARELAEMLRRDPATGDTISATPIAPAPARPTSPVARRGLLSDTLASAVYWLVFLLFLPAILDTLNLQGILEPIQSLLNELLAYLPNLLAAGLILAVGWFIARVVRRIVTNLAAAVGADRLGERVGLSQALGSQSLSGILGLLVYVLILVPVLIASLNALAIEAITGPASAMLNSFLTALPNIFAAALVLVIAYFVGKIVANLVTNVVRGLGFDRLMDRAGLGAARQAPEAGQAAQRLQAAQAGAATPEARQAAQAASSTTPSDWVGYFVLVGVMLFAALAALNLLGFAALTALVSGFIVLVGQIMLGLVIFGIGLFLAGAAARAISGSGIAQAGLLALTARVAILALAGAMALRQMGLANEIINLAFGLTLGAIAVAFALAFGLGAREVAGREAERWFEAIRNRSANARAVGAEQRLQGSPPPPRRTNPGATPGD